jgi:ERCC4-type nuclease
MIVTVDIRETALLQQINILVSTIPVFKSIEIRFEALPIGDIIIGDGTEDKLIIERKSINDLLSSIKDGRYEEQSYRLNGLAHHNHNIIYLIEGDVNKSNRFKSDNHIEKLTAYSAMFSLNYYKGFSVFRSFSLDETASIICNMAYKLGKDSATKNPYYKNIASQKEVSDNTGDNANKNNESIEKDGTTDPKIMEQSEKDYVNVIKKVKKDNITPDNIGEIMLCQIPGISSVTALAVMQKYQTIPNLIKELEMSSECLKDLYSTNSKGQVRKISKTCITNIVKFLLKK